MLHVRRKFVDEVERTGSPIAQQAIKQIAQLYAVEKEAQGKSPDERVAMRQAKAKPVFDALEIWLQAQLRKISGKTKLAEAIRYALNRMPVNGLDMSRRCAAPGARVSYLQLKKRSGFSSRLLSVEPWIIVEAVDVLKDRHGRCDLAHVQCLDVWGQRLWPRNPQLCRCQPVWVVTFE